MTGVLTGFAIIGLVIFVGYIVGRAQLLGTQANYVLSRAAFYVFTPSLLLTVVAEADLHVLVSPVLLAVVVASLTTVVCYVIVAKLVWKRDLSETVIGAMSSAYLNANNIGLPVALYVLGNAAVVAPVLLYQTLLATPVALTLLELRNGVSSRGRTKRLLQPLANPVIITTIVGLAITVFQIPIPDGAFEPFRLLGNAAVPALLLSFGISLHGRRLFAQRGARRDVVFATALKLFAMPTFAALVGVFVLGLKGDLLYVAVALAALPTAQNVYNYALRYERGESVARDTVLLTTLGALPVLLFIAGILTNH